MRPASSRRRWRVSLLSLFLLVAVLALVAKAAQVARVYREVTSLRETYKATDADYDCGVVMARDVCQASLDLCRMELRLPLADRRRACQEHLECATRICEIYEREFLMGRLKRRAA